MIYDFLKYADIQNINSICNWATGVNPFTFSSIRKTEKNEPDWYICSIKLSNNPIGYINSFKLNSSAGTSIYLEEALVRSIGEAIERYSSSNYFMSETPYFKTINEAKNFVRCADCEKAPISFKQNGIVEKIEHTQVVKLADNSIDYLPYETVHLGFQKNKLATLFSSPISTGCSFFNNKVTAVLKGIMEVIERDAMMRWWYLNFPNTKIINTDEVTSFDIQERLKRIKRKNIEIYLFEISQHKKFPVVFCLLKGNSFPYACFGASCDTSIKKAMAKSLDEAISIRAMAKWHGQKSGIDTKNFEWMSQLTDHMELYANWENSPIINKITSFLNAEKVSISAYPEKTEILTFDDLQKLAMEFVNSGFDIYYKDLTLPEIAPLGNVIKVVIPQMIPLSQSYKTRWLSSLLKNRTMEEINPYPQPFA